MRVDGCDEALTLLHDRLDGDLSPEAAAALETHLAGCSACAARLSELAALDRELARDLPVPSPAGLAARLADGVLASEDRERSRRQLWLPVLAGAGALALLAALASWGLDSPWFASVAPRLETPVSSLTVTADDLLADLTSIASSLGPAAVAIAIGLAALQAVGTAWLLGSRRREAR